ncbi:Glutamine-dependent NAD(+) synthetase [termite gut metagenome]|uniref:Glutamine-dependent NAD(+) synthetase n=1 Tax=termite gut metagenome TaxID=433724 RepID=A0A5J4RDD2_9ZZZZ
MTPFLRATDGCDQYVSPDEFRSQQKVFIEQKTEDIIGPYELHDFILYHFLRFGFSPAKIFFLAGKAFKGKYTDETLKKWIQSFFHRFFTQQFKRSCFPDGPKVGSVSLSPRGDWRMPSDASPTAWLEEIEKL